MQASNLYKESRIYKIKQIETIDNWQFVEGQIQKNLPKNFDNHFAVKKNQ